MPDMPAWQMRVIWFAACYERYDAIGVTQAVELALRSAAQEYPAVDEDTMRREMLTWLRENAINTALGTMTILPAADRLFKAKNEADWLRITNGNA